ncbi:MAG: phosphate ABC transporter permease subunit PstC [Candidatus Nezhaarchaeota archaeon]|nr:phosphate ABC transporter permease subunit PstC [Candidatus Nezhaarchaeota archaeon]MCX8141816.1 phosphate ABC transporter permease subunit PstC [Candidatus Nezhaarchaeota archaeon]
MKLTGDNVFKFICAVIASSVILVLGLMIYELTIRSRLSIETFGTGFIVGTEWDPVKGIFGALPLILGTLTTSAIALLIGLPISLGVALAISEYMPQKLSHIFSFLVELLAAIPSVIYGLWGLYVLIPFLRDHVYPLLQSSLGFIPLFSGSIYGGGILTGGIVLAIMIIPIISSVSRDLFSLVPRSVREAVVALGATKWETVRIVMSYARSGILGAAMLGLGRAVGEAMAITMVIGNQFKLLPSSLFDAWYTMSAIIVNELLEAIYSLHVSALINIGLLLLLINLFIVILARLIVWRSLRMVRGIMRE